MADGQLAIVGPVRDEKYGALLHSLTAELGIADDVVFVGGIPLEETVRFYQAADVFVYPSFNETFGLPILEAYGARLPGRHLGHQRHAGNRRRSRDLVRARRSGLHRAGHGRSRGPGAGPPA